MKPDNDEHITDKRNQMSFLVVICVKEDNNRHTKRLLQHALQVPFDKASLPLDGCAVWHW